MRFQSMGFGEFNFQTNPCWMYFRISRDIRSIRRWSMTIGIGMYIGVYVYIHKMHTICTLTYIRINQIESLPLYTRKVLQVVTWGCAESYPYLLICHHIPNSIPWIISNYRLLYKLIKGDCITKSYWSYNIPIYSLVTTHHKTLWRVGKPAAPKGWLKSYIWIMGCFPSINWWLGLRNHPQYQFPGIIKGSTSTSNWWKVRRKSWNTSSILGLNTTFLIKK